MNERISEILEEEKEDEHEIIKNKILDKLIEEENIEKDNEDWNIRANHGDLNPTLNLKSLQ